MTEKKSSITFEDIMRRIEQRQYAPVYILMGDESYYIDQIADDIANSVLKPEEQDFNQTILFGADVTAAQVVDIAKGYPMMSSHRVVIVKEAQNVKSLDALEKYLVNPMSTTILVWCHKNGLIDKRKKVVAKAESVGIVFESKKKRDYELNTFINKYLKAKNVQIDAKSSDMIAEHVGADLSRLVSELDKIILSLDDKNRIITPEMVEQKIGISKEFNTFELRSAIINKDVYKANLIINYFEKNPKSGSIYAFLPLLFSYFQNLMIAYYAPNRSNEADVARFLELKSSWAAKDYILGMRNYSGVKAMQIIEKIREVDAKSKGLDNPNTSADELMKELLFFILH
ncbi:DNA polymerase III subunit delta [Hoylesella nanceiensis]|uniref:DNA polymerase III subunit delta n=1 Tax=Hoylesella nanceiensis TaxID=425941 RepID=UPI001CB594A1|nr:DNA polymerase III subunit delta [Hoylesella nanceiensis]MBF1427798.1 DNA polymerase III subunit delta [Hoylesella nanceiensis]